MMRLRNINRPTGFTITELIVVVAILSIVCVVGAAIAVNSQRASSYADRKNESVALGRQIIENLRFDSSCTQALGYPSVTQAGNPDTEMITPAGWEIKVKLEGIKSGTGMSGTEIGSVAPNNLILGKRLAVKSLKLADGILLDSTAGIDRYLATVYLQTSEIGGITHRAQMLGTLTLRLNASNQIQNCQSITTDAFVNACTDMGCTYNGALTPPCRCKRSQVVCSAPGFYATSFNAEGVPVCEPAGGGICPTGEYLAGFGIDEIQCTKAPTTTYVNGQCGGASGNSFVDATAANAAGLCAQGTASPTSLAGAGPWAWDCNGANGGTNASPQCTATQSAGPTCATQTISNCDLTGGTAVGSASGTCAAGYTGSCSYTCNAGPTWGAPQTNSCVPVASPSLIGFYLSYSNAGSAPCYARYGYSQRDGVPTAIPAGSNCPYQACVSLGYTVNNGDIIYSDYPDTTTPYNNAKVDLFPCATDACLVVYDNNGAIIDGAGNVRAMLFCKP